MSPYQRELLRRIRHAYQQRERHWAILSAGGQRMMNRAVDTTIKDAHAEGLWREVADVLRELEAARAEARRA